jgi:hypothetical protein
VPHGLPRMTEHKRMRLGDILLMRELIAAEGLAAALERQRQKRGRLGESIVELGLMTPEQMSAVIDETPTRPLKLQQTGVNRAGLLGLMLKFISSDACETLPDLAARMKLPIGVLQELIDETVAQHLVQVLGSMHLGIVRYIRYGLTDLGRSAAAEAFSRSQYLGPAPVSLTAFQEQVRKQAVTNENFGEQALQEGFAGLIVPSNYVRKLLPAVRAGRTVLLYGAPGNGKTSIGKRIAALFRDLVYIPYAIEVNGQIIKMYDTGIHRTYDPGAPLPTPVPVTADTLQLETFDTRWVACRRPVAVAGGELTLEMLDLRYDANTKFYDAPLHMKALNGLFLIDDFGRQKVSPTEFLNRWIVPLESRIDFLTLHTGQSFMIPFDELVIFSTNLEPADLMDPAFLRRIPYKIELVGPTVDEYRRIFFAAAESYGLSISMATFDHVVQRLQAAGYALAYFQPRFLCEQISQICNCFALPPAITRDLADEALANLYVDMKQPEIHSSANC